MMKRMPFLFLILMAAAPPLFPSSIINDINYFSKLFPRTEGSINEKQAFDYVRNRLELLGTAFEESGFEKSEGHHSFSRIIKADIPGNKPDCIVIAVPMNTPVTSEKLYGAAGPAMALAAAERFGSIRPDLSVSLLFLGAEYGEDEAYPLGSRHVLDSFYAEAPAAVIYLDLEYPPSAFSIISGSDGKSAPFWLYKGCREALADAGIDSFSSDTDNILCRLGLNASTQSEPWLRAGIPAVLLKAADSGGAVITDEFTDFMQIFTETYSGGFPSGWDSNYLFNLDEKTCLLLYITVTALMMIYPIFRRRHFGWYMKTLARHFWNLPLLYFLIFLFLSIGSLATSQVLTLTGFPNLILYRPDLVFAFRMSVSLLLFSITFRLLARLPFSRKGSFYSITALFFLVIALVVISWIEISAAVYPLWALVFVFLFTVFRKPAVKALCLSAAAVPFVISAARVLSGPYPALSAIVALSPLKGSLLLGLLLLPFVLALMRLDLMIIPSKRVADIAPAVLAVSTAFLFAVLWNYTPFGPDNPVPVTITETVSEEGTEIAVVNEGPERVPLQTAAGVTDGPEHGPDYYVRITDSSEEAFLSRRMFRPVLDFNEDPYSVSVRIIPEGRLTLFDCSYPATYYPETETLSVFIGKNPPNPLEIELTLNSDASFRMETETVFIRPETIVQSGKGPLLVRRRTIVKRNTDVLR